MRVPNKYIRTPKYNLKMSRKHNKMAWTWNNQPIEIIPESPSFKVLPQRISSCLWLGLHPSKKSLKLLTSLSSSSFSLLPQANTCSPMHHSTNASPSQPPPMGEPCSLPHAHAAGSRHKEVPPPPFQKNRKISFSQVVQKQKKKNYWIF